MVRVLKKRNRGIEFKAPILKEKGKLVGFIFIDNTDLCEGKLYNTNHSILDVLEEAQ